MLVRSLLLVLTLAAGYLGIGVLVVLRMTSPRRVPPEATPSSAGLGYEEVDLWSTDGLRLSAWWVPAEGSSRVAVLIPGWGGSKADEHVLRPHPSTTTPATPCSRSTRGRRVSRAGDAEL